MTIQTGSEQDIPAIIELLKKSLGESLMPKSEIFWRWKHVDNPFGKSPLLLAWEGEQLIGVRAFMRWEWKQGSKLFKAVRAVDTATDPAFQGKGIFKKLTLQLVEQCREEKVDFIFNTPNASSKPGYFKMGWYNQGKMKLAITPVVAFRKQSPTFDSQYGIKNNLPVSGSRQNSQVNHLATFNKPGYLDWRYTKNPNINYYGFSDAGANPSYFFIFRLKKQRFGTEFRICDFFVSDETKKIAIKHLREVVRQSGAIVVSSATPTGLLPTLPLTAGPEITVRPLSFDDNYLSFHFWKPSLGDMEVF